MAAVVIPIPTPRVLANGRIIGQFGKTQREFPSAAAAREWAAEVFDNEDVRHALGILIAVDRPALRGRTIVLDTAVNNIARVV